MAKARPHLDDVDLSLHKFEPGDRILVRTSVTLTTSSENKLRRTVERFCGEAVRVLVINCMDWYLLLDRPGRSQEELAGPSSSVNCPLPGIANVGCTTHVFRVGDTITLTPVIEGAKLPPRSLDRLKEWVGDGVELVIL